MQRVQQVHRNGCVIATLAMLTEKTYDEVIDAFVGHDFNNHGISSEFEAGLFLTENGFAYQKKHKHNALSKEDREDWPTLWATSNRLIGYLASVRLSGFNHAVAVEPDGTVLDPWREGRYTLADYELVNHLIAVYRID